MGDAWKGRAEGALEWMKWLILPSAVGMACGAAGALFHMAVDAGAKAFASCGWLLFFLPVAGLIIALLYRACRLPVSIGTDRVFESTRSKDGVPPAMAPLIFVSTALTHLCGGSSGREGAALQLGGGIACMGGRLLRLPERELHVCEMCGMSALFSALFGTPLAASFFVLEVVDVGRVHYRALFPCVLSSVCAFLVAGWLGVAPTRFALPSGALPAQALSYVKVLALAALGAMVSILFCHAMHFSGRWAQRLIKNDYLRIALGGALVVGLTLALGTRDYNGAGMGAISRALAGEARWEAWAVKLLFTCVTLGCGFKGGEIVPSFFVGACFGCVAGGLLGLNPCLGAALGMVSVFCGVTNTPAASLIMAVEMFGAEYLLPFGIAVGASYFISGKSSLYFSQHFLESKLAWGKEG